jgi:hypothetical protein
MHVGRCRSPGAVCFNVAGPRNFQEPRGRRRLRGFALSGKSLVQLTCRLDARRGLTLM